MQQYIDQFSLNLAVEELSNLLGESNQHLKMMEQSLNVQISHRGDQFKITSTNQSDLNRAIYTFNELVKINHKTPLNISIVAKFLQENIPESEKYQSTQIKIDKKTIYAKSANQAKYIENLNCYAINFAIGPAGSGKSWLSVAYALSAYIEGTVQKIILCRPVLEAGEKLGFLPGDLAQKIDPFLKPLLDALYDIYSHSKIDRLMLNKKIEILPLAYMRGRTLNEAVIILDEAQNTTSSQMKMFLTRMGYNSKLVITGDLTQNDLPKKQLSGLTDAKNKLEKLAGIGFNYFDKSDIVRHPLVQKIVACYDEQKD